MEVFYFFLVKFIFLTNSNAISQNLEIEGSAIIFSSTFNVDAENNKVGKGTATASAPLQLKSLKYWYGHHSIV